MYDAAVYVAAALANISPGGDHDVFSVSVPDGSGGTGWDPDFFRLTRREGASSGYTVQYSDIHIGATAVSTQTGSVQVVPEDSDLYLNVSYGSNGYSATLNLSSDSNAIMSVQLYGHVGRSNMKDYRMRWFLPLYT